MGANYTVAIASWNIVREDGGVTELSDSDVFEAGKDYAFCVLLHAKTDYEFWRDTTVTINGSSDILDMESTFVSGDSKMIYVWTLPTEAVEAEPEFELDDVNMDGVINTGDAVIILRQNVGIVTFTEQQEELADYNKDGKINTGDAVAVLRYCVSKAQAALYVDPTIE